MHRDTAPTRMQASEAPSSMRNYYEICRRCIMDTSDPGIVFDDEGICSHCRGYEQRIKVDLFTGTDGRERLAAIASRIKAEGVGKDYDCVIGLSGGIDSTMVAYKARELGLRALAVHLDNGWNSELAVRNIEKTVKALGFELYTLVLDWDEFRDLQLAFVKAGVANLEIPTDHVIVATLYRLAAEKGIRHILSGSNLATEAIMPEAWGYDPKDWYHIKSIHAQFGTRPIDSLPHLTLGHWGYYTFVKNITFLPILNYVDYDKEQAKNLLGVEIDWKDHGGKHFESIFTRFFQAYYLPTKFGFDKRRAHLSSLINSQQMSREDALTALSLPAYPPAMLAEDRTFVLKKLGLSEAEFMRIMGEAPHSFTDYPNHSYLFKKLNFIVRLAKRRATRV